jgi:hypothetical protein
MTMSAISVRYILVKGEVYLRKSDVLALIYEEMVLAPGDDKEDALLALIQKLEHP